MLPGNQDPETHLCLPPLRLKVQAVVPRGFNMNSGDQTEIFILKKQAYFAKSSEASTYT